MILTSWPGHPSGPSWYDWNDKNRDNGSGWKVHRGMMGQEVFDFSLSRPLMGIQSLIKQTSGAYNLLLQQPRITFAFFQENNFNGHNGMTDQIQLDPQNGPFEKCF